MNGGDCAVSTRRLACRRGGKYRSRTAAGKYGREQKVNCKLKGSNRVVEVSGQQQKGGEVNTEIEQQQQGTERRQMDCDVKASKRAAEKPGQQQKGK